MEAWMDVEWEERRRLADLLLKISETVLLLNNNLNKNQPFSENFISNSILAEISAITIQEQVTFPGVSLYRENQNKIIIPREVLQLIRNGKILKIFF